MSKPRKGNEPFGAVTWPAAHPVMRPIASIKPYERNPRTHPPAQVALLAEIMKKRGVDQPIVVDEKGIILKGHGRRLAAIAAGFEEYPVVTHRGLSETDKAVMRIEDNQVALLAGWDAAVIKLELGDLKLAGFDVQLLGFPEAQLRGWGIAAGTDSAQDPEKVPERPAKPIVRKGDLWLLGAHRLLCGDATSESDVAACLGGAKPKLAVTDPPYGVDYDPEWRAQRGVNKNKKKMGAVQNDHQADWRLAWQLFTGDVIYAWSADLRSRQAVESLEESGFIPVAQIIWAKDRFALGRGDYHFQHEPCWYAVRKGKPHHWNGGRSQTTLWTIAARDDAGHGHGTQKPVECMKRPIENNSRKGDHVYDPFVGSGTTIIACQMTGRRALAIEIDEGYAQVSIERWQTVTGQKATLDGVSFDDVKRARTTGRAIGRKTNEARGARKPVRGSVKKPAARVVATAAE